jgi:TonB family protein
VIVKAVIRSDGQLADVFVQKSSGYSVLDEAAAMEAPDKRSYLAINKRAG